MAPEPFTNNIFESFNARHLSARQVAATFIPPPTHFEKLVARQHSLVVGPRGSGKTTLLKMLQLSALAAWQHNEAERFRTHLDFVGVFVAADASWGAQLRSVGWNQDDKKIGQQLALGAFATHVLIALVDSMSACSDPSIRDCSSMSRFYVAMSRETETMLADQLAGGWQLTPRIKSLLGVKLALRERLMKISALGQKADPIPFPNNDFLNLKFMESVVFGIEAFNGILGRPDLRWALLFDELEIAPKEIRVQLFNSLRSVDDRLLFKLSISPYHEDLATLDSAISAMDGQDYQTIRLWYPRKEDGYTFTNHLLKAMLVANGIGDVEPDAIFGPSEFDLGLSKTATDPAYAVGGPLHTRFKNLARQDGSFSTFLKKAGVDLDKIDSMSERRRASTIRKVTTIVAVREAFRFGSMGQDDQDQGANGRERSRKNPQLYTGARSIFAIVEGNPRWLIGLVNPMIKEFSRTLKRLPRAAQAQEINSASNRFRSMLRTIPFRITSESTGSRLSTSKGLLGLLDRIGNTFHEEVVKKDFSAEPPLSFIVDSTTSDDILEALGRALNAGAIIFIPDGEHALASSLKGKRFRLSYMLAPGYGIPLTMGRGVSLSQLLVQGASEPSLLDWIR